MLSVQLVDPFNTFFLPTIVDGIIDSELADLCIPSLDFCFSPSGLFLASVSFRTKTSLIISIWDLRTLSLALYKIHEYSDKNIIGIRWIGNSIYICLVNRAVLEFSSSNLSLKEEHFFDLPIEGDLLKDFLLLDHSSLHVISQNGTIMSIDSPKSVKYSIQIPNNCAIFAVFQEEEGNNLWLVSHLNEIFYWEVKSERLLPATLSTSLPNSSILQIVANPTGKSLLVTLKDRTIRTFDIKKISEDGEKIVLFTKFKLHDAVNRWVWTLAGYSNDGDVIWGTTCTTGQHLIYLWDSATGDLIKILEGPKDDLMVAKWDPFRPALITASLSGRFFRWIPEYPVKWASLVPGLEEIKENIEYAEREDEFDLSVEEELSREKVRKAIEQQELESQPVDVLSGALIPDQISLFLR